MRCRFSCHLLSKKWLKILTSDDLQQSYIKLLLKHFMPSWQIEVSLFLSSSFQIVDEDPEKWWYTPIVSYTKLLFKHFTTFRQIEVSLLLSSPFQTIDEDPHNWWYSTIVYKAVTKALHTLSTSWGVAFPVISFSNNRWRSWQLVICKNRI